MNWKERRQYWKAAMRIQSKIEAEYVPKVQKVIKKQVSSFLTDAKNLGFYGALGKWNTEITKGELYSVIMSLYKKSAITFANVVRRSIKGQKYLTMGRNEQWTQDVIRYLGAEGLTLVNWMDETSKQIIIDILKQGVNEGLGFEEVANRIADSAIADRWRIVRIVRTESMRAANYGAVLGAKSHGLLMKKEWISANDNRTRQWAHNDEFDHTVLDGQKVMMDDGFTQTGTKGLTVNVNQPGAPVQKDGSRTPGAFTINCRCVVGFEAVRDQNGRLIRN